MQVLIDKSFQKDLAAIKNKTLNSKVAACIEQIIATDQFSEIKNIKS